MPFDQSAESRSVALLSLSDQVEIGSLGFIQHHRRHLSVGRKLLGDPWGDGKIFSQVAGSRRAHIRDSLVPELADGMIKTQVKEIGEMEALIADLERSGVPAGAPDLPPTE